MQIIDAGPAVTGQTARVLRERNWLNHLVQLGRWTCLMSGDTVAFRASVPPLVGESDRTVSVSWNPSLGFASEGIRAPLE